jgi:hypothetical protein
MGNSREAKECRRWAARVPRADDKAFRLPSHAVDTTAKRRKQREGSIMKMKAIFTVEFEVEDGANAHAALDQALGRAETALKESIERSTPGAAGMDVRPNSTSIAVTSQIE